MSSSNLACVAVLSISCVFPLSTPAAEERTDVDAIERRIATVYERVANAVVRIEYGSNSRSGVIVDEKGIIVTSRISGPGSPVTVHLADGRTLPGSTLGWSDEWGVGLVRIAGDQEIWPHVELAGNMTPRAGELCLAIGFPRRGDGGFDQHPSLRLGCVTASAEPTWFTTSCAIRFCDFGCGVFSLDGELLGVTARISPTRDAVHTMAKTLQTHWNDLAAGRRLDDVRFRQRSSGDEAELSSTDEPLAGSSLSDEELAAGRRTATSATVRLRTEAQRISSWSGVVVTADGYVVTCAHTRQLPGERVTVHFPDGRDAAGVVLGTNRVSDVGLVKITEDGPWPHVEIGDSFAVRDGDRCIIAGYPARDRDGSPSTTREPLVQTVKSVKPPLGYASYQLFTELAYEIRGGMSGGGVFDAQGRLVAVHSGGGNPRVEVVRTQWDQLAGTDSIDVLASEPLEQITAAFERDPADRAIVVEVLGDGERRALGTIVASDGRVVTKASELLTGSPSCRMPDGRVLPARIIKASREYDLALLQVDATELPVAQWSEQDGLTIGTLLAALLPDGAPLVGTICQETRGIPAEPVWRSEGLRDTDGGLEVHDLPKPTRPFTPIRRGDIVLRVEGRPTPDARSFEGLLKEKLSIPAAYPGDAVQFAVRRGSEVIELRTPLPTGPRDWYQPFWKSARRSGFPDVFDADVPLEGNMCGGPVVDKKGAVIGIAVASMKPMNVPEGLGRNGGIYVVPAAAAAQFVGE